MSRLSHILFHSITVCYPTLSWFDEIWRIAREEKLDNLMLNVKKASISDLKQGVIKGK